MHRACILAAILLAAPAGASAVGESPTATEVKKVLDYYFEAGETSAPVLVDARICGEVATDGKQKNECTKLHQLSAVPLAEPSFLWLNFMVPQGTADTKVLVQFDHEGVTRMTRSIDLSGAVRFRAWKRFELDREGTWSIEILHDRPAGVVRIGRIAVVGVSSPVAQAE